MFCYIFIFCVFLLATEATDCFLHVMLSGFFQGHWLVSTLCQILFSMAKFIVTVVAPHDPTLDICNELTSTDMSAWMRHWSSETQKYSVRTSSSWLMMTLSSGHFFLCFLLWYFVLFVFSRLQKICTEMHQNNIKTENNPDLIRGKLMN